MHGTAMDQIGAQAIIRGSIALAHDGPIGLGLPGYSSMTTLKDFVTGRCYSDPDREALCRRVAAAFVEIADAAIAERGRFVAALTGGRTARTLHRLLAHSYEDSSIWKKTHLFWGDERLVPPDHPDSNYGVAYADLVSKVGIPSDQVHRIRGEIESPDESALRYEVVLHIPRWAR